jgi:hypothetical protein
VIPVAINDDLDSRRRVPSDRADAKSAKRMLTMFKRLLPTDLSAVI